MFPAEPEGILYSRNCKTHSSHLGEVLRQFDIFRIDKKIDRHQQACFLLSHARK